MVHERPRDRTNVIRVVGLSLAAATLLLSFRDADPERVAALLRRVGAASVLIVVPQFLALFAESVGWRLAFDSMRRPLPLIGLFRARLATEALAQTLPMGVVFCESMKPVLLARNCGADLSTSLAGMAARKWLLVVAQSVYVGAFALLAWATLGRISAGVLHARGLPWLLVGASLLLALLALSSFAALSRGKVASRLHAWLTRLPWAWLRRQLEPHGSRFSSTDGRLEVFFANVLRSPWPVLGFLGGWLLEAVDTLLILYLLGVRLPWTTVGAVEVASSFLRNVAFVVPAGLGVQDLSYLTFLRALHVPDALNVAAAFLLLKRCKECFWALCGYVILAIDLRSVPAAKSLEQAC